MEQVDKNQIMEWLEQVKDPEIPVLSLVDLGVITSVTVQGGSVRIDMTPTFVGCPALSAMQEEIRKVLWGKGVDDIEISVSFTDPWTSDKISEKGKAALKSYGLAPPPPRQVFADLEILQPAECPRCGSHNTDLRNPFGTTLCRAIHYCRDCKESFEQFKPL